MRSIQAIRWRIYLWRRARGIEGPLRRFVPEGSVLPTGYGVAWRDFQRAGCVAYPVPLNLALGALRKLWHHLRVLPEDDISWQDKVAILTEERNRWRRHYESAAREAKDLRYALRISDGALRQSAREQ